MKSLVGSKKWLALMMAGSVMSSSYGQTNLSELNNELEIMTSILSTALKQNVDKSPVHFRSLEATYLAKQGVVFNVSTSGSSGGFNFVISRGHDSEFLSIPPIPPIPEIYANGDITLEFSDDNEWQEFAEEAVERAREAMEEAHDKLRDLRQQEREYAWERRELERRKRDQEFEMRSADKARKQDLMKRNAELEDELKALQAKQKEIEQYAQQIDTERKAKAAAQAKARQEQYKAFLSNFELNIADTLCKYGAGLKALPKNENVSFVLSNFSRTARSSQDRIYVFTVDDIQDCVRDKIDSDKLLQKSESYLF